MNKTLVTLAALAFALVPMATANHGLSGTIVAALGDGSAATASISYVGGNYNTQVWGFRWSLTDGSIINCNGFGSLEIGFVSVDCGTSFSTGGTGDSHGYPYEQADVHQITVTIDGVSGTGQQVVCPDSGNQGLVCNLVVGSL